MSRTVSLGTKRSGVGVAIHSSLVRLRVVFVSDFCDFQQTRKQQLENNIVNVLEHMSRVSLSLYSQSIFFLDKKLKKTHRSHEIYLFTVLSFVIREWHVQSTYPVRQNFNEWRYSSDFLALETRLSNECRRQFSILLHSYCLTLRLVWKTRATFSSNQVQNVG